jgi:hypothetical protein
LSTLKKAAGTSYPPGPVTRISPPSSVLTLIPMSSVYVTVKKCVTPPAAVTLLGDDVADGALSTNSSKSYVVLPLAVPIVKLSTFPTKFSHAPAPKPATIRTPPSPLGDEFAITEPGGSAAIRVESGTVLVPGPEPPVPKTEYQHPDNAFHVCQVSTVSGGCGFEGQNVALW